MSIQAIDRSSVHSLTSGQVVIDLQTAVKELVENALDAGATSIDVKFKEHGIDAIEVQDNGKGIDKDDWAGIALKHHTSKLSSFADLTSVSTLGFRGEALSSLCGTANLSLVTCTAATAPVGTSLTFTRSGECVVGGKAARSKGTTIKVEKLFESLPVRRKELIKNAKREFGKALELLQAYALISTGVRFEVKNTTKSKTMTHLQSPASPSLRSNFSSIFAPKSLQTMTEVSLELEVVADKSVLRWTEGSDATTVVKFQGLVSKPSAGNGRTSGNRQFYYINGRPFHPTKIAKAVNEVYKSFVPGSFPTVVADFQLATDAYDVNVSPDKRTIFLHSEGNLISALKSALEEFYKASQSTFQMTQIGTNDKPSKAATAKEKEKEKRVAACPGVEGDVSDGGSDKEEGMDERPRKKRKTDDLAENPKERVEHGPTSGHRATSPSLLDDASMDTEIDAGLFASEEAVSLPPEFQLSHEFDESEFSLELPVPPSPIRRACQSSDPNRSSSPNPSHSSFSEARSPTFNDPETNPVASTSHTSPTSSSSTLPHPRGTIDKATLFRSSPSPTPATAQEASLEPRSPSRSPSPTSPRPPSLSTKLRQPQLSFGKTTNHDPVEKKKDRKGKGKADRNGLAAMRNLLKSFVKPGGMPPSPQRLISREDEEGAGGGESDSSDGEQRNEEEADELDRDEAGSGPDEIGEDDYSSRLRSDRAQDMSEDAETRRDRTRQEEEEEEDQDDLEIVEDSFVAAKPEQEVGDENQGEEEEEEDELEVLASSCACVHGSPVDAAAATERTSRPAEFAPLPLAPIEAPFGGAPAEVAGIFVAADTDLDFDLEALDSAWSSESPVAVSLSRHCEGSPALSNVEGHEDMAGAGVGEADDAAEATLSRIVSKDDFDSMEVIGQFNLGFIIARRKVATCETSHKKEEDVHDDLFIIDQHASDEKYNFEKLQAETVIQSQRLLAPRVLNLPSHDEITAIEHLDLLRLNGYDVVVDEDADVGERVKLLAQPVSNKTVFDIADFEELLDLISNRAGNEVVRPSKTRKMFASRACRKSVMIGKALNSKQMTLIVRHMGGMDQPWACPHGRPTMRWLAGLGSSPNPDSRSNLGTILRTYDDE